MKKIIIIGAGGAGKSTLAHKLGQILNIEVFHLDALFWKPNWTPTPQEEWESMTKQLLAKNSWIIDGNFGSTMDLRIQEADTIIFLDYSTIRCLYGVIKRRIQYHGKTRPDMGDKCPEKLDFEFIKWIAKYRKKKSPNIIAKLNELEHKTVFHFRNPKETKNFLEKI
ncbi:DNA topology modulation protein [Bacillus sp. Bva_UNVM-123]|uniref:DNA topology modulation protein n=1 Tax=Bacillus sp. Bva_UNVM-123 TaxID=2829798 RepID=UPI00391F4EFD